MAFDANDPKDVELLETKINEALAPLISKRDELLRENRTLKSKKDGAIDPAEVERLENQIEELNTKLTAANKDLTKATKAAETATAALTAEQSHTQKLLVENGLVTALTEAGVKDPVMLKAAAALLRAGNKVEITVDGENRVAKVGDKALGDFVKGWAQGDEGKAFVAAPQHGGGGAPGGGKPGGAANPFAKDTFDLTAQGKLYTENPTQAKALAAEAGVTL